MASHELGLVSLSEILRPACLTLQQLIRTRRFMLTFHLFDATFYTLKKKTLSLKSIFQHVVVSSSFPSTGNSQDDNYTPTTMPDYDDDYDYNATFDYYYGNSAGATQHSDC